MAKEDRILIEVEVNAGESAEALATIRSRMQRLKEETKSLRAEQKAINEAWQQSGGLTSDQARRLKEIAEAEATNTAQLKELTAQEKVYTAQIQIATQNDRKFGDSIIELGAQLAQLKQEYRSLSAAQRESDAGKHMQEQIADLDAQVKQFDYSLGDHQRNVGNYTSAMLGLNGNVAKVAALFQGGLAQGFKTASVALKSFAKTLLATPLGWIVAGVAAVVKIFGQLREAFKRNDDAGTALSVALSRLQPIVTFVREAFNGLATAVATVVGWATKAATAVLNLIPAYRQAAEAAAELVTAQDRLEDSRREFTVNEAKRDKEIASLRKKAMSDEKLTAKEREEIYKEIDELSRKNMEDRKRIAEENYRIMQRQAKQEGDASDETKDRLAQAYADMLKAQTEYLTETTRIGSRQRQAREEQAREEEARRKAAQQAAQQAEAERKARLKAQQDELLTLEDLQIEAIKDEAQRARAEIQTAYTRRIEDLKRRLEEEKTLTAEAREAINGQIVMLERQQAERLAELDAQRVEEQRKRANEIAAATVDARVAAIEDVAAREIEAEKVATERKIEELRRRLEEEKNLTIEEISNINELIAIAEEAGAKKIAEITANARAEAVRKSYAETRQAVDNGFREALLAAGENARAAAEVTLSAAEQAHARLLAMDTETKAALFENEEAYKAAVLQSEGEIAAAREQSQAALQEQSRQVGETMKSVTVAMSSMFEAVAGDTEEYENFKKAMAIVDALISMATTIASATAASTAGDPYTMAIRIAANVAAVTAQFASVIAAIKAAAVPSAPKFAEGGIVPGTSYAGDKVIARVNSREMILTQRQQANLFDLIQAGVPQTGIDYRMLQAVFTEAVAELPPPVLGLREFAAFERKVRLLDNITKI